MTKNNLLFVIISLIITVYVSSFLSINSDLRKTSYTPYYSGFIRSLQRGSIYLDRKDIPSAYDLSNSPGGLVMYWGITPVLAIYPLYLLGGVFQSDIVYTFVFGIINIIIFYFCLIETSFVKNICFKNKVLLLIAFSLLSPNFYLSLGGRIWHTNQVISITYLLLFLFFCFRFNRKKKIKYLLYSSVFFTLAFLARNTLIIYGLLFLSLNIQKLPKDLSKKMKLFFVIFTPIILGVVFFFIYNYLRYGSLVETGISQQMSDPRFSEELKTGRLFSLSNLGHNIRYYFFTSIDFTNGLLSPVFNPEGTSVFLIYPQTLLLIALYLGKLKERGSVFFAERLLYLITFLLTISLLLFVGTGWTQFGARYFFDAIPALMILIAYNIKEKHFPYFFLLTVWGILVNIVGGVAFYNLY